MEPWRATVVLVLLAPAAAAAEAPPELPLVEAYLAQWDRPSAQGEHCRRHGGPSSDLFGDVPTVSDGSPVEATNDRLREHLLWHREHTRLASDPAQEASSRYGEDFVMHHRAALREYDAWRAAQSLAPVAPWDPATPIPPEFAPRADAPSASRPPYPGCAARATDDPRLPLPSWATTEGGEEADPLFGHRRLCAFRSLDELGKAIDHNALGIHGGARGYHAEVHTRVGGDLADPSVAPRDPVFWAWHKFLDAEVFERWASSCGASGTPAAALGEERDVPAAPGALAVALALAALARRALGRA